MLYSKVSFRGSRVRYVHMGRTDGQRSEGMQTCPKTKTYEGRKVEDEAK